MFFLWIILFFLTIIIIYLMLIAVSKLKLEIYDTKISSSKVKGRYINKNYKIRISFCVGIFKILNINITKTKLEKKFIRKQIDKLKKKLEQDKNNFDVKTFKVIKELQIEFEKIILNVNIGIEDAKTTALLVGAIYGMIANLTKKIEYKKFDIIPNYGKNLLNIDIECIIIIPMLNIIKIICILQRKKKRTVLT